MEFNLNRINPNQTQVFFKDGRFETLTNQELEDLLGQFSLDEQMEDEEIKLAN